MKKSPTKCICLAATTTTSTDEAVTIDLADPKRENGVGTGVGPVMTHGHAEGREPNKVEVVYYDRVFSSYITHHIVE